MRTLLLLSLWLAGATTASLQTPAPAPAQPRQTPAPAPGQPRQTPAAPAPTQPRATTRTPAPATGRSGIALTVTDGKGATLSDVAVDVAGPTPRNGQTDMGGQINFPGLQPGTYRLRFSGEAVTAFEREVVLRAGQIATLDIVLTPAPVIKQPPPPEPVAPPAPSGPTVGPAGQPQAQLITDVLEKDFVGKQPRRETLLSCSGNLRTTMIQLNEAQPERLYQSGEVVYYVLGGEGSIVLNGRDTRLMTNSFVSVPRGTSHSLMKRGSRALIVLAVLAGEACEQAK